MKSGFEDMSQVRGTRELVGDHLPTFITIFNLNDHRTIRVVRPEEFGQVFGDGVRLQGVSIEITDDHVTRGIESRIPFLKTQRDELSNIVSYPSSGFEPHLDLFVRR